MTGPTTRRQPTEVVRESKADSAYEQIRASITSGAYQPGSRLVLDRLARELDMSTLPVREAIRRLEAEGYVEFRQNVGATVTMLDADGFVQALDTLAVLESAATAHSAPRLSEVDLVRARELNGEMETAIQRLDSVAYATLHDEFHELLSRRCPNQHLIDVVTKERSRLHRVRRSTLAMGVGGRWEIDEHERLLELVEQGAPFGDIEQFCRAHIARASALLAERAD